LYTEVSNFERAVVEGFCTMAIPIFERVLKATHEQLALPKHVSVPEPTQHEHATAILTGQEIDKALEPSEECVRAPLSAGFRQQVAGRSTSPRKHSCQTPPAASKSARIGIKAKTKILFIDAADLIAVEAKGNHVLLVHTSSSHILRGAISNIEEKLNLHGFVRIHRSVLVNGALVEEIHARPSGEYVLRVRGGREFTVTRTYKKNLRLLAQLWIGMEGFDAE
jgi:two-component system LytT family response regulator